MNVDWLLLIVLCRVNLLRMKMIHICGSSFYVGPVVQPPTAKAVEPLLGPVV
jgi:hypothetical protein